MEKRSIFGNRLLPYVLLLPQLAITLVFFYWPASQAAGCRSGSRTRSAPRTEFVGFENYQILFADPGYYEAMWNTAVFSVARGRRCRCRSRCCSP